MRSRSGLLAADLPALARLSWCQRRIVEHLHRLRRGRMRVSFGAGKSFDLTGAEPGPSADLRIRRPGALLRRLIWRGDLGFGEAYIDGDWESTDPAALLELFALNLDDAYKESEARHWLTQTAVGLQHWLNRNTRGGSRRNIAAHYDLGNDFYAQWLDPGMTYSAGVFAAGDTLQQAQDRKYQRMLELVDPRPGQHVLEIGCGWGGFAEYAARRGLRVTGLTLSAQQLDYARQRIARAGLQDRVELRLCDYRDFDGRVDHIVSIEMFEAVGRAYWTPYFETLARCLRRGGRAVLQVITIDEARFDEYVANPGGFIQRYIFPGGMLPTKTHLSTHAGAAGLQVGRTIAFGLDYAETLARWTKAFDACGDWLAAHGYDERFQRMWRYYLAFCEGGFRARHIDVVQTALTKP
jgi:cyclopropane-fatty-acyl-phospholipid synthase